MASNLIDNIQIFVKLFKEKLNRIFISIRYVKIFNDIDSYS